jgi:hypothetical protein
MKIKLRIAKMGYRLHIEIPSALRENFKSGDYVYISEVKDNATKGI